MCSYSGVVTCLWRHGNIFICEVSVSGTKVTASCKNRKTFMTKIGTLNFLLLLVSIYQKLSTLQVIFQWIIIIILKSSDKNMLFSIETCVLNSLTKLVRFRCTDIFRDFFSIFVYLKTENLDASPSSISNLVSTEQALQFSSIQLWLHESHE